MSLTFPTEIQKFQNESYINLISWIGFKQRLEKPCISNSACKSFSQLEGQLINHFFFSIFSTIENFPIFLESYRHIFRPYKILNFCTWALKSSPSLRLDQWVHTRGLGAGGSGGGPSQDESSPSSKSAGQYSSSANSRLDITAAETM